MSTAASPDRMPRDNVDALQTFQFLHFRIAHFHLERAERECTPFSPHKARELYSYGATCHDIAKALHIQYNSVVRQKTKDRDNGRPWAKPERRGRPKLIGNQYQQGKDFMQNRNAVNVTHHAGIRLPPLKEGEDTTPCLFTALQSGNIACLELMQALRETIANFRAGRITPSPTQTDADTVSALATAMKQVLQVTRDMAGLRPGQLATPNDQGNRERVRLFRVVTPTANMPSKEE